MFRFGTIRWFNTIKGFGFIIPDDGGADVLLHANRISTRVRDALRENVRVVFKDEKGQKGFYAVVCHLDDGSRFNVIELPSHASRAGWKFAAQDRLTGISTLVTDDDDLKSWQTTILNQTPTHAL